MQRYNNIADKQVQTVNSTYMDGQKMYTLAKGSSA